MQPKKEKPCAESQKWIYAATQSFVSLAISNVLICIVVHCICYDSGKMQCNPICNQFWSGVIRICQSSLIKPNQRKQRKEKHEERPRIAVSDDVKVYEDDEDIDVCVFFVCAGRLSGFFVVILYFEKWLLEGGLRSLWLVRSGLFIMLANVLSA